MSVVEGTVDVPVVGKTKKAYVAVAVALVAGIVGWAWYRRQDGAAADGDASFYADTRTGSELPTDTYTNPGSNADGQSGTGIGGDSTWHAPSTDPEWAQDALERLTWYEPGFVSATVGKYLARQPLTSGEQTLIREIWAQIGRPPGNQPIVTTPNVPVPASVALTAPKNLKVQGLGKLYFSLHWDAVPGAAGYSVKLDGKQAPSPLYNTAIFFNLKPGTKHTVIVQARGKGSVVGPASSITVTTKK